MSIKKADDEFYEVSHFGKMVRTIKLNEIAYTELIFSSNVKASYGKIEFKLSKGSRSSIILMEMQ
jgi:hypothetical protein